MSENNYNQIDKLNGEIESRFGERGGSLWLTLIILLSGVLSALFFWKNSELVFVGVHPTLALILGLLVGLVPAEGAFFGWRTVRAHKVDLTTKQMRATALGLVTAVISSIFSTFALYVASFTYVPEELSAYDSWLVFIALSVPIMTQVAIFAWFSVEERLVVENHERAKLKALSFDADMRMRRAQIMATIAGAEAELDRRLEGYGEETGREEAVRRLGDRDSRRPSSRRPSLLDLLEREERANGVPTRPGSGDYRPD